MLSPSPAANAWPVDTRLAAAVQSAVAPEPEFGLAPEPLPSEERGAEYSPRRALTSGTKPTSSLARELLPLLIKILAILAATTLIFTFLYGLARNTDPDMAPAVKDGDLVLFYRLDKDYAIGDLLLLEFQGNLQVRRVIAQAGDRVDITENGLVINGAIQQEPDIYQTTRRYEDSISFPLTVGQGQVFVLGDSRENATDSRVFGPVSRDDTLGTVITIIRWRGL